MNVQILEHRGRFLKPCPGTQRYICCGYWILHLGTGCPMGCTYCILQAYLDDPRPRIFGNMEQGLEEALQEIGRYPERIYRVGTGEFMDSLALDPKARFSEMLLPRFSKVRNAVLELKTKTTHIHRLLSLPQRNRIIVSWSLNSPSMADTEERGAPAVIQRIQAAQRCQEAGFVVGFHFDPLIWHDGWEQGYEETVSLLRRHIDPGGVIWVSMGSLRFMPMLKAIIRRRHPQSRILNGEFIRGLDGKMRYFKPIRIELYQRLRELLEAWHPDLGLYLCMESDEVWQRSMGWSPGSSEGLSRYLDGRVQEFF